MKNNTKTTIFLTTKKGEEKGTKDIYLINQDGETGVGGKGIVSIYFDSGIPIGVSAKNPKTGVLLMNPTSIIIDPVHPIEIIDEDGLSDSDKLALKILVNDVEGDLLSKVCNELQDEQEMEELGALADVLDTLKDLSKDAAVKVQGSFLSLQDVINELKGGTTKSSPVDTSATDAMNELAEMFKSGKIDDKRFRELIPEGSFLEFSKKLSTETGDPSFYNIAKVLEALKPTK